MERSQSADATDDSEARRGILLIAHGSRDPAWAAPFERLRERIGARAPLVALAYLERMTPDIEAAVRDLVTRGCTHAVVVPLFLGQGGHVRDDLPRIIAAEMRQNPSITLALAPPVGEDPQVLDAIAAVCVAHLHARR